MGYKFLDFGQEINDQLEKSLIEVLHSGFWSTGPQSKLLEESLSKIYQRPCVTTSSGGTALQTVSLLFPQIKKIAVQSNTYFASCLPWVTANKEIKTANIPIDGNFEPTSKPKTIEAPKKPSKTPTHCFQVTFSFNKGPAKAFVKIGWRVTIKAAIPVGSPFDTEKKTPPR